MIEDFSLLLLGKIIQFIPANEIFCNLIVVSKKFHQIVDNPYISKLIVCRYYSDFEQIKEKDLKKIVKSLSNFKIEELPFWGMRTNAGVSENSLRFWIGKTFMKTNSPQVGLKIHEQAFIEGGLAKIHVCFKNSLITFANFFQWDEIYELYPFTIEEIEIYSLYRQMYNFPPELSFNDISVDILKEYGIQMSQMIQRLTHQDQMKLQDDLNPVFQNYIGEPRSIEIGRNTEFNKIVKTLMIYTSCIPFPDQFESNLKCQNMEQLEEYVKLQNDMYQISRLDKQKEQFECCTFESIQQQQYQPLLWINFKDDNCKYIITYLNKNEFRWCKYVYVRILDIDQKVEWEYEGVSLEYISLKGMMVDENSFEYVEIENIQQINQ